MADIQKITPSLWYNNNAEEAVHFYASIFKNSSIKNVSHYGKEGHEIHGMPEGTVLAMTFELDGQDFIAINGGPIFKFTEAISLMINCDSQQEIDYYWEKLTLGGDPGAQQCGWLKDKYGLSWQVAPKILQEWMSDPDKAKTERIMRVMMPMKKLDIAELQKAYEGN